jgi:hypothetical protein
MEESLDKSGMTPTEFVLWLNGVIDVLDARPPSQAQWDTMRSKVADQIGAIVADRIRVASRPYPVKTAAAPTYYGASMPSVTSRAGLAVKSAADAMGQLAAASMAGINYSASVKSDD